MKWGPELSPANQNETPLDRAMPLGIEEAGAILDRRVCRDADPMILPISLTLAALTACNRLEQIDGSARRRAEIAILMRRAAAVIEEKL